MAYPYRNSYGSRDDKQPANFNRLGGGMINGSDQKTGGLMRRFTTNALPTLSPIGQQRRQAAGETQAVSTIPIRCAAKQGGQAGGGDREEAGIASDISGKTYVATSTASERKERSDNDTGRSVATAQIARALNLVAKRSLRDCKNLEVNIKLPKLTAFNQSGLLNRATPVSKRQGLWEGPPYDWCTNFDQSERRIRHIEQLLEQQRSIEAELEKIDNETRREVEQGLRHERAVSDIISQSEPTSPPSEAADVVPSE